jgi:hypothetical protein
MQGQQQQILAAVAVDKVLVLDLVLMAVQVSSSSVTPILTQQQPPLQAPRQ